MAPPTAALRHLWRSMIYQERMGDAAPGKMQAALRAQILADKTFDAPGKDFDAIVPKAVVETRDRLMAYHVDQMPPPLADVALLVDAICMRHGFTNRADAWASIGISGRTGSEYLGRQSGKVTWPIWFCLRHAALSQ